MSWWHLLGEVLALGLAVTVGTIAYLFKGRKGNEVEEAASLEVVRRARESIIMKNDRGGA